MIKILKNTLVEASCLLGESPVWDSYAHCLYWIDITSGQLHRFYIKNRKHEVLNFKRVVCAIARCSTGQILIAFKRKIAILNDFHIDSLRSKTTLLSERGIRFNDGQIDPNGRLWIGSMSELGLKNQGVLMKVDSKFKATVALDGLGVSNGMCWSRDKSTFYHIDTYQQQVKAYDYSEGSASIGNPRVIAHIPKAWGKPDGMTIDIQGKLWIALWGGGAVSRWDPATGICIGKIDLPVSQVTSCVFGGDNLSDLYITSARIGLGGKKRLEEPLAGSVFKISIPGVRGLPANNFKL
ncbi:SMP-30/gluconolactonase/LRE family protein [Gramella sp. AN32]|uniref:Regucalcin n=1 Tax=Christiangramia antarctica TaxID=2058158 RepID=A0ABW5X2V1_9FLAO|nr:SMP-30/gluconolactonase/LRE family protein [Gramella sp. AN32]MCM4155758.1 SMP-30/gluconolaconase/LRE domain protein [Gramella sp. AN32]